MFTCLQCLKHAWVIKTIVRDTRLTRVFFPLVCKYSKSWYRAEKRMREAEGSVNSSEKPLVSLLSLWRILLFQFFWIFSNFVSDWAEFNLAMLIFSFRFEDWSPENNLYSFAILGLFRSFSLFSFCFIFFNSWFFSFFKQLMMSNILAIICTWKVTWSPLV